MMTAQTGNLVDQVGILLDTLELSGNKQEFKSALRQFTRAAGFQRFAYVCVSSHGVRTLTDLPQDWENRYHGEQFAVVDPVVRQAKRTMQPFCWSLPAMGTSDRAVQAFCRQVGNVGVVSGMTIPIQAGFGRTAMLSFMTDQQDMPQFNARALQKAAAAVAYMHLHLSQPDATTLRTLDHSLTPRELTCLHWMSLGKKKSEIAQIHSLSEKTVRFYLDNAKTKLNATNAPHMVRLAFEGGIIALR
jgi:LuxR family transcriptional activator of conjugal transfer of Ti plasmids